MKVVVNKCYGGYGYSPEATLWLFENGYNEDGFKTPVQKYFRTFDGVEDALSDWRKYLKEKNGGWFLTVFSPNEEFVLRVPSSNRRDPLLVKCVETLGKKANDSCSNLVVVEIPDGIEYEIEEYDGQEWVAEKHRTW